MIVSDQVELRILSGGVALSSLMFGKCALAFNKCVFATLSITAQRWETAQPTNSQRLRHALPALDDPESGFFVRQWV